MCWKKAIASIANVFANATNFEGNIVLFHAANKEQEENCCLEAYQHSLVIDCGAREEIGSWIWNGCDFLVSKLVQLTLQQIETAWAAIFNGFSHWTCKLWEHCIVQVEQLEGCGR